MKDKLHPENYRFVVFKDMSNNTQFFYEPLYSSVERNC